MFELTIKSEFAASHFLRGHQGKCKNLHGHTWKIEVVITGVKLNTIGVVIDFKDLRMKLERFLETIDHHSLNNLPYFQKANPTAENIAQYIFNGFSKHCRPLKLKRITVWESDRAGVTYCK